MALFKLFARLYYLQVLMLLFKNFQNNIYKTLDYTNFY